MHIHARGRWSQGSADRVQCCWKGLSNVLCLTGFSVFPDPCAVVLEGFQKVLSAKECSVFPNPCVYRTDNYKCFWSFWNFWIMPDFPDLSGSFQIFPVSFRICCMCYPDFPEFSGKKYKKLNRKIKIYAKNCQKAIRGSQKAP